MERPDDPKEWRLIEKMLMKTLDERKTARRWGIFFKLLTFAYLLAVLVLFAGRVDPKALEITEPHVALIEVAGVIAAGEDASADRVITSLRRAHEEVNVKAIILRINSPGGSPVQAGYIYDEIKRLQALDTEKPIYAVIVDIGASGGYYIAAAADEIYADKASLVGSIGVTAAGFGFVETLDKLGVERRNYTSGEHKSFLDPFQPEDPEEVAIWEEVLATTHQQFIEQVKLGRGDKLETSNPLLFSGVVWTGEQAQDLGLVDGLGSSSYVAREVIGVEELVDYSMQKSPFEELLGELGASFGGGLITGLKGGWWELR